MSAAAVDDGVVSAGPAAAAAGDGEEAKEGEAMLIASLVEAADIHKLGTVTRSELHALVRLHGPMEDEGFRALVASRGSGPFGYGEAEGLLGELDWDPASLREAVARVTRSAALFQELDGERKGSLGIPELSAALRATVGHTRDLASFVVSLDAGRTGRVSWAEFFRGVASERFGARFTSFRELAIEHTHLFEDVEVDLSLIKDALRSLNLLERIPTWFIRYRARRAARKVHPRTYDDVSDRGLSSDDLDAIDRVVGRAVAFGVVAGVGSAFVVHALYRHTFGATGAWPLRLARFAISVVVSGVEVACIYAACVNAAVELARICGLRLWPLDHDRALTTAALARAALEIPQPVRPCLGIDPMRKLSGLRLYGVQLLYAGKRGISLFLLKLFVKKVLARVVLRGFLARQGDSRAVDLFFVVLVNAIWNLLMVASCCRSAKVCCLGPPAATKAVQDAVQRFEATEGPLGLDAKELVLRAVGVSAGAGNG